MLNLLERVKGITHPMVQDIYLKKNLHTDVRNQDIVVIEVSNQSPDVINQPFDVYLSDLLPDLPDLRNQVREKIGPFGRIDIRPAASHR